MSYFAEEECDSDKGPSSFGHGNQRLSRAVLDIIDMLNIVDMHFVQCEFVTRMCVH